MAKYILSTLFIAMVCFCHLNAAPAFAQQSDKQGIEEIQTKPQNSRTGKQLAAYIQELIDYGILQQADGDDNEVLSRGAYPRRPNSPIYYIRLPPEPYMFIPGLGYVSQPPRVAPLGPTPNPFIHLPVNFLSNGKPDNIYQWSGGFVNPKPTKRPVPTQRPESNVNHLPGQYPFNGRPTDIMVLRDSYNSLYSDALQNFYP